MITVTVPTALRAFSNGAAAVSVEGATVMQALDALTGRHPSLRRHLFEDDGALRAHVNIFVNESDVRTLGGITAAVRAGDTIMIVPSIAGGSAGVARNEALKAG